MSGNDKEGFVLVELLVVVVIIAMISTAIFTALASGLKIWKRVNSTSYLNEALFGWEELQRDLNNQIHFQKIGFVGKEKEVAFPILIPFQDEKKKGFSEIGVVRYYYDAEKCHCLCQQKMIYEDWLDNKERACKPLVNAVEKVSFEYFGNEEGVKNLATWQPQWPYMVYPMAVKLKISFDKTNEKEFTTIVPMGM